MSFVVVLFLQLRMVYAKNENTYISLAVFVFSVDERILDSYIGRDDLFSFFKKEKS